MTKESLENDKGCGMYHEYLYGSEAELYAFYRFPKALIENKLYVGMSAEAKLLYVLFLDRAALSASNNWRDELGRIYIIYPVEDIMRVMGCGNQKAAKILMELEQEYGLIERKKQGFCKPNLIYVKSVCSVVLNSHLQTCENHISGSVEITSPEVLKSHANNTNINKTNIINTNPILSGWDREEMGKREVLEKYFYRNLSIESLKEEYPTKAECIDEIYAIVLDTVCSKRKMIRISGDDKPKEVVYGQFMKLEANHIRYVLEIMEKASNIRNTKQYILTALYNATLTINSYFTMQYNNSCEEETK
ncbi:MAG: replication initiator protein A [Lachnospiraceae bacterium]|nr:replication initiator protein A [Lachnospiraceae bacterium]